MFNKRHLENVEVRGFAKATPLGPLYESYIKYLTKFAAFYYSFHRIFVVLNMIYFTRNVCTHFYLNINSFI